MPAIRWLKDTENVRGSSDACYFFTLPPELRDEIYELAYAPQPIEVDFIHAARFLPAKSLLLSCKQIYNEAQGIYWRAYQRFWAENTFTIGPRYTRVDLLKNLFVGPTLHTALVSAVQRTRDEDLAVITRLCFRPMEDGYNKHIDFTEGVWDLSRDTGIGRRHFSVVVLSEGEKVDIRQPWGDDIDQNISYKSWQRRGLRRTIIVSEGWRPWSAEERLRAVKLSKRTVLTKYELDFILAWWSLGGGEV